MKEKTTEGYLKTWEEINKKKEKVKTREKNKGRMKEEK